MHYKSGFTYSSCGLFTENIDLIQKFRETGSSKYIYRNKYIQYIFKMTWL